MITMEHIDDEFLENFPSVHTRAAYKNDIIQFFRYLADAFADFGAITDIRREHVVRYRNFLSEVGGRGAEPCAPKSIARKLASLSSYFSHLVEKGILVSNPASSVRRPRRSVRSPAEALDAGQVRRLLAAVDDHTPSGALHKALLATFFTTGLRKSEVLRMKFSHYGSIGGRRMLEYTAKGGRHGRKFLHPLCVEALDHYIDGSVRTGRTFGKNDWLFRPTKNPREPDNLDRPLNPKTINQLFEKYAKKAGLDIHLTPHGARATFIGELLEQGVDIYSIAEEVDHACVTTTGHYDRRRKRRQKFLPKKLGF